MISFITLLFLSGNPFLEPLTNAHLISFEHAVEISASDRRGFSIYDQTHKIDSVDFYYLDYPVIFLAVKEHNSDILKSVLFYVEGDSLFEKKVEYTFGPPKSTMTVDAMISDKLESRGFEHTSKIWLRENFSMLVSQVKNSKSSATFRVWMKQLE